MRTRSPIILFVIILSFLSVPAFGQTANQDLFDRFEEGAYTESLPKIRILANDGDATAQYFMGEAYFNGWGVRRDNTVALMQVGMEKTMIQPLIEKTMDQARGENFKVMPGFDHLVPAGKRDTFHQTGGQHPAVGQVPIHIGHGIIMNFSRD